MASKYMGPQMMMVITFAAMMIVNTVLLLAAHMLFPSMVVLGTLSLSLFWALMLSAGKLALIETLAMPFFTLVEQQRKKVLTPAEWMLGYFVINAAALWLLSRVSEVFGLGISSWIVVVALAAVLDIAQGMVMMIIGEQMKR